MNALLISLILHGCILFTFAFQNHDWFPVRMFEPMKIKDLLISKEQRVRVEVLDLPDFERYVAAANHKVAAKKAVLSVPKKKAKKIPKIAKKKAAQKKKTQAELEKERKELIRRLRERAGNILQEGSQVARVSFGFAEAEDPDDPFWQELKDHILQQWVVHAQFQQEGLSVAFHVNISSGGEVIQVSLVNHSEVAEYDAYVRDFIENQLDILLEIPERFHEALEEDGVNIIFEPL